MELTSAEVSVRVCTDNCAGSYTFRCPSCRMAVAKAAEPRIVELLMASGVRLSTWRLPAELTEVRTGSPISHDDLLDFHQQLHADDSWTEGLRGLVEG